MPRSVLLGFLPVTLEAVDNSKAYVYYTIIEIILKYK
jgi:hypothetical protein